MQIQESVWMPEAYKYEKAIDVSLSGTALTIPNNTFHERFADKKITLIFDLSASRLYYLVKDDNLVYLTSYNFRRQRFRQLTNAKIIGDKIDLTYSKVRQLDLGIEDSLSVLGVWAISILIGVSFGIVIILEAKK